MKHEAGLDHGELSRAPKHIIVDAEDNPRILDFETASTNRKVSNVTSMCHFLFMGSHLAQMLKMKIGEVDQMKLIEALRSYKKEHNREGFAKILMTCELDKTIR